MDAQLDGALIRYLRWRAVVAPLIFLSSIPVALTSPHAAGALWLLAYPAVMLLQHGYTSNARS